MKDLVGAIKHSAAGRTLFRSDGRTRVFFQRQIWIWPLVAALLMAVTGYFIRASVERSMRQSLAEQLRTILDADVAALRIWMELQESNVETTASDRDIRAAVADLVVMAHKDGAATATLLQSTQLAKLREEMKPWLDAEDYHDFVLIDRDGVILAASRDEVIGKAPLNDAREFISKVLSGKPTVSTPFPSIIMLPDQDGQLRTGVPTMFAAAPVSKDDDSPAIAALCLRLDPTRTFTHILQVARIGQTGETYAFNENGLMLSESRFTDDLVSAGLIAERPVARSTLNLDVRDPGVDLTTGMRPTRKRSEQPLTRMAASAIAGESDVDSDGYRDYRGVPVVGAWTWLPEYNFGVAAEVDVVEAYRPLYVLRRAFWGLFGLLATSAAGLCAASVVVARLQQSARRSALKAKQLGQYLLDEKIGQGGMGVVYRGHHAMLRRPTAIKLLDIEQTTEEAVKRFEREVRLTCQLNHPNTIAIYDYGRTPEGLFYYAMEYLDGLSLQALVDRYGPLPEGRVVRILEQVCGSLAEAHDAGLVHRDIKPANIMIGQRGGLSDFVKVLDFGLVRASNEKSMTLTASGALTGTPLYMSPEAIERPHEVDARSDLYAVGAVGVFLLTGRPVFSGDSVIEVCMQHFSAQPELPSTRLGKTVSPALEDLLMRCLAKRADDRPASARQLAAELENCGCEGWSEAGAERWWREHAPTALSDSIAAASPATADNKMLATIIGRPEAAIPGERGVSTPLRDEL